MPVVVASEIGRGASSDYQVSLTEHSDPKCMGVPWANQRQEVEHLALARHGHRRTAVSESVYIPPFSRTTKYLSLSPHPLESSPQEVRLKYRLGELIPHLVQTMYPIPSPSQQVSDPILHVLVISDIRHPTIRF